MFSDRLWRSEPTRTPASNQPSARRVPRKLNDTQFDRRMSGTGPRAVQINQTFQSFTRRYGLDGNLTPFDFSHFRPPRIEGAQMRLF